MADEFDFAAVGGTPVVRAGGDPADPADREWNFGLWAPPGEPRLRVGATDPSLYQMFPAVRGRWRDAGRPTVNHELAAKKVLGRFLPAHQQRSGTCGSASGRTGVDLLQYVLIALGKRATFKPVSHAWIYFLARREFGMLGRGDGVAGGSVPPVMAKYGVVTREEAGDPYSAGPDVDRVADAWGAGRIDPATVARLLGLGRDNPVAISAPIRSFDELADALYAGAVVVGSDSQGFTMERDRQGFCRPRGTWHHYHTRVSAFVAPDGREGCGYRQSWGESTPSGPPLEGHPGCCFGVDAGVQDQLCRSGEYHALFGVPPFDEIPDPGDWVF